MMKVIVSGSVTANNKSQENQLPVTSLKSSKLKSELQFPYLKLHCVISSVDRSVKAAGFGSGMRQLSILLPTGDCKASVNTKILSFLLSLYLLPPDSHIHSCKHTYTCTCIPHAPCQHAPVTSRASLYMEHMLGNVTALAANGSGTLQ